MEDTKTLGEGATLLLLVNINYSETFGLRLQILDIDPSFSLVEVQKQREETLRKLEKEDLFNGKILSAKNKPKKGDLIETKTNSFTLTSRVENSSESS